MRPPALVVLAGALCSAPIAPEWTRPPRSLEPQQPNDADGRYPKPDEVASPKRELSGRSSEPPPMPKLPSGNAVTNVTTALGAESEDDHMLARERRGMVIVSRVQDPTFEGFDPRNSRRDGVRRA